MRILTKETDQFLNTLLDGDGRGLRERLEFIPDKTRRKGEDVACYCGLGLGTLFGVFVMAKMPVSESWKSTRSHAVWTSPVDGGMIALKAEKLSGFITRSLHRRDVSDFLRSECHYQESLSIISRIPRQKRSEGRG